MLCASCYRPTAIHASPTRPGRPCVYDVPDDAQWAECRVCGTLYPLIDGVTAWDESDDSVGLVAWGWSCPNGGVPQGGRVEDAGLFTHDEHDADAEPTIYHRGIPHA